MGTVFGMEGSAVGPPVVGAQLTLTSGNEIKGKTTSDGSGHYAFDPLETGRFTLTISAPGFAILTPAVNLDRDMKADFAMKSQ